MGLADSIGGVVSGVLNQGGVNAPDLTALFNTIKNAGANQRDLINQLPENLKPLYDKYIASTTGASDALKTGTAGITSALTTQTADIYNGDAAKKAEDAAKTAIYANVPGQQDAIRQALAASGGFDRGTAGKQLAAPVIQAGQAVAQNVLNTESQQLQAKQTATQNAVNSVARMNEDVLQSQFGMSKEQALQILNGNRADLKEQLTSLINQSNNETGQMLGVQGADINNKYNKDVADKAQKDAFNNALVNVGVDAASPGFLSAMGIPASSGFNPATMSTNSNYDYSKVVGA